MRTARLEDWNKPCIYKFINKEGVVIYIGSSERVFERTKEHFSSKSILDETEVYEEVEEVEYTVLNNNAEKNFLESYLISYYLPKYNTIDVFRQKREFSITIDLNFEWREINVDEFKTHPKLKKVVFYDDELDKTYQMKKSRVKGDSEISEFYVIKKGESFLDIEGATCTVVNAKLYSSFHIALRILKRYDKGDCRIVRVQYQNKENFHLPDKYHRDKNI